MKLDQAQRIIRSGALDRPETFYGPEAGLALGVGLLIDNVEFPIFHPESDRFRVVSGLVLVLSHECDLDPSNDRLLNDRALICPILSLSNLISDAAAAGLEDHVLGAFLGNLATRNVSRAVFMPEIAGYLDSGGLIYLNEIASTPVSRLIAGVRVCAVSAMGLVAIDMAVENHLRRPKSDRLPLTRARIRNQSSLR